MSRRTTIVLAALVALGFAVWHIARSEPARSPGAAVVRAPSTTGPERIEAPATIAGAAAAVTVREGLTTVPEPDPSSAATHRFLGRVLDEARRLVTGASVALELDGLAARSLETGADGRFELALRLAEELPSVTLVAHDGRGAAARRLVTARQLEAEPQGDGAGEVRVELEPLVLLPAHPLRVTVVDGGAPASGARLRVELGHARMTSFAARADARGEVLLEHLPAGPVYLEGRLPGRAVRALVFVPEQETATLLLAEVGTGAVRVVDSATKEPVAGARVALGERLRVPARVRGEEARFGSGEGISPRPIAVADTDDAGLARFGELVPHSQYYVEVSAEGRAPVPAEGRMGPRLVLGDVPLVVELAPLARRSVRWPVVAGELPVPADGTPLELRVAPGILRRGVEPPAPVLARMEGSLLVTDDLGEPHIWIARAPDGALARLWVKAGDEIGGETSFRRPRRVEVRVRDAALLPIRGATVVARDQGNNDIGPAGHTDAGGLAALEDLHGGLADIYVDRSGGSWGRKVGQVNLDQGNGRIDAVSPGSSLAHVAVRIEGQRCLPPRMHLSAGSGASVRVRAEDPGRAELELEVEGAVAGASVQVWLTAAGFQRASATLQFPLDGSPAEAEIELERSAVLHVSIVGELPESVAVVPERFDEESSTWKVPPEFAFGNGLGFANGPSGSFLFGNLTAGRWRAFERESGTASSEAEILPGMLAAEVELELAGTAWVSGRVELEDPGELQRVLVRVEGVDVDDFQGRWLPGTQPPTGTWPKDGAFKLRVLRDRDVRIVPWHPWLVPSPDGTAEVRGGAEDLVLRLVEGDGLRLAVPQQTELRATRALRVGRFAADAVGELSGEPLEWHHAPLLDGVARCALPRGTWTLWIDPGQAFQPLVLRAVAIEGAVERTARFERGSAVRVRVLVPAGQDPPRIYVSASPRGGPTYLRDINSRGEAEVVVPGLGPGRFKVSYGEIMGQRARQSREVEVDGIGDVEWELDLR